MDENELERIRRDLTWLISAPPLLRHPLARWQPADAFPTDFPSQVPDWRLEPLIPLRRGRLGTYFEALAGVLFEHSPDFTVLARNRIIEGATRTLGELDLLVADHRHNRVLHLELALKFYLKLVNRPDQHSDTTWIGAGQRDFLALKHERLIEHQIQLPGKAKSRHCWPEDLPFPDVSMAWVTGRLFVPPDATDLTPMISPEASLCFWVTLSDFEALGFEGTWIGKGDWLGDCPLMPSEPIHHPLPGQFFGAPRGDSRRHWFVVPDDWPESARQRMLARFYPSQEETAGD